MIIDKGYIQKVIFILIAIIVLFIIGCSNEQKPKSYKPLVYLNHIYLTVNVNTSSAIKNSAFLQDNFGNTKIITVGADGDESWTGIYIFGENTYLELFPSNASIFDNETGENIGISGIGFGVETIGDIDTLFNIFGKTGIPNPKSGTRHRNTENGEISWYYWLDSDENDSLSILDTWTMEYVRSFMTYKFDSLDSDKINISRKLYNKKDYNKNLLIKDIIEIELSLIAFDKTNLLNKLEAFDYKIMKKNKAIFAIGPQIKFIIRNKTNNTSGISRIRFTLNKQNETRNSIILSNKSEIKFNKNKTADWYFFI